jgi:hypothetical protein
MSDDFVMTGAPTLSFTANQKPVLIIRPDGRIELGEGASTDDATRALFSEIEKNWDSEWMKLKARNAELEAALREISYIHDGNPSPAMAGMPDVDYARFVLGEARRVARAALGEKKDGID